MENDVLKIRAGKIFSAAKYFTLIELLVVIAIISILACMLLPALKKAREIAISSLCLNQEKTMGLSILMYCNDYNGWIPVQTTDKPSILGGADRGNWAFVIAPYVYAGEKYGAMRKGTIFVCPGDKISKSAGVDPNNDIRSYVANANILKASSNIPIMREGMITKPSNTIIIGELNCLPPSNAGLWTLTYAAIGSPFATYDCAGKWIRQTHGKMQNFLLFDGHVEALGLGEASAKTFVP